ncbi:Maf-like protein yceF [Halobacteriovorax marinus SJ]|uniref:dTTP/UTP pyrophosphatase n=1 Tax=Halobacteriovorax marinus (strain ATCC BAA-682 / DSM 15412 / SJ) TaxID=862908 RepID=E1X5N3_HALMS|nr:Maf family protein [Halobacteriovorax marinus]CBW25600.1 Maf-like protein yceF [Halobacteriovorax marinus SJ]
MKLNKKMKLILASSSPRRKELLGWLNIPFEIVGSGVEEITEKTIPTEVATDLAALKGRDILGVLRKRGEENPFIIASDTIVTYEDKIYGKPKDVSDAKRMLLELEGKKHSVVTGVYLSYIDDSGEVHERIFSATSQVTFEKIDRDILDIYLESGESLDKAGAYGIQGRSLCFISKVEGSYSNVVGFPISDFLREFKDFLGHANSTNGEWRELFEH